MSCFFMYISTSKKDQVEPFAYGNGTGMVRDSSENGPVKSRKRKHKNTKIASPAEDWKDGKKIFDIVYTE